MKIAILSINTNKYNIFFDTFYKSSKQNFFPSAERKWFVFSDQDVHSFESDIETIQIKHEEWPFCTLKRFEYFLKIEKQLLEFDYVFFFNANSEFINKVDGNDFGIGSNKELIAYKHIKIYKQPCNKQTGIISKMTEQNIKSNAYINDNYIYCCSCINGGKPKEFLTMCKIINNWMYEDLKNNIIPIWHDESYFNKYQYLNQNLFHYLSEYNVFPENQKKPRHIFNILKNIAIIKLRDKNKYFNVSKFKGWCI